MSEQTQQASAPVSSEQPVNQEQPTPSSEKEEKTDAVETKAVEEEIKKEAKKEEARRKKLKLKVDGKEIEEEVDLDNDEYLVRQLQLAKMAQKRAQEKASLEKDVNDFISQLRKNPRAILESQELGINFQDLVNQYVEEQLANAQKTPEQLEKEKVEKELKQLKDQLEKERETQKQKELQLLEQREFERYEKLMANAIEKTDLPKSPYVVKKIADYMLTAVEAGFDVSPDDVLPLVREEIHADLNDMFQVLPEEVIEKILGDNVINKLRKKRVAKASEKLTEAVTKAKIQDVGAAKSDKKEEDKKISYKDFFKL